MAAVLELLSVSIFLALLQPCLGVLVEEPKKINLDILKAIYSKKSLQTRIEEGVSGLPENIERIGRHISAKDELDCSVRYLAYNYSKKILSSSANIKSVADGLQLSSLCGISPKTGKQRVYMEHEKQILRIKAQKEFMEFFVDARRKNLKRTNDGSKKLPFTEIEDALEACETKRHSTEVHCIIRLREGMHFLKKTLQLNHKHSNVLITRYMNENTVVSGGIEVETSWDLYSAKTEVFDGDNNIFEGIQPRQSTSSVLFMGVFNSSDTCKVLCEQQYTCTSYTFFGKGAGNFANMCYGRLDGLWSPIKAEGAVSGRKIKIYVSDISGKNIKPFHQIFVNGKREVRARYPNGNPETTGLHTLPTGYISSAEKWLPPKKSQDAKEIHFADPHRDRTPFSTYYLGIGGPVSQFDPPVSYWGVKSPAGGGGATYAVPSGLQFSKDLEFVARKWNNASTGIVHAFQHYHWENWNFKVDARNETDNSLRWSFGGFQGARGAGDGKEWYVENIFEELDVPGEWFLDEATMKLYYFPSGSLPSKIIVPQMETLMRVVGTQEQPIKGTRIMGVTFEHTESTFMKGYAVPSGGDWTVHMNGMVFAQATENLLISGCTFTSPGGNGIIISNYTRNATISDNYISFAGDNGIAVVGHSDFFNGTNGNQPRGTKILRNIIHDNGVWGKGTYSYSQSVACLSNLEGNVFFNGPRGSININDGFGGGNVITKNVLFNFVRETLDHGPINTWDRVPYLTKVLDSNHASLQPMENFVSKCLIMGNYNSVWPIDHDDGSSYWADSYNFLAYGGYKNYLGHSKKALENVYVYPDKYVSNHFCMDSRGQQLGTAASGWDEAYVSNKCIINNDSVYLIGTCSEEGLEDLIPYTGDNKFYTPSGAVKIQCGGNTWTLDEFQKRGFDVATTVSKQVGVDIIIGWGGPVSQFDPPVSYWGVKSPAGGGGATYAVPSGLQFSKDLEFVARKWNNASTGIVHAFQHYHWENWNFKVDARNETDNSLRWSFGGFQGARGAGDGKEWYVENIFEELDVPGEWFLDEATMKLYYFPSGSLPSKIIVPQMETLMRVVGTQEQPIKGTRIMGVTFEHTESTFMKGYAVPSGGDWTVHMNGMVFAQATENLLISGCTFTSPGGNGIIISNYTRNATISDNYISFAGDNGIAVVGHSDFFNGTNGNQPRGTKILRNIIHDNGVWGKGTYSYSQSVACLSNLEGNVFFNGPRGSININDGFGGGNVITKNVLFNFVRETLDHGPINTWDRVPYLTKVLDSNHASLQPMENFVSKCLIMGNYNSVWPIDHDDGSSYWADSYNFLAYGGYKNYLGHSKKALENVYVYPDKYVSNHFCMDSRGQQLGTAASGWDEAYVSNKCIINNDSVYLIGTCSEEGLEDLIPYTGDNKFYTPSGAVKIQCGGNTWTLDEFQKRGFDVATTVSKQVGIDVIIGWGKTVLDL